MGYLVKSFIMYEELPDGTPVQYLGQWNWIIFNRLATIPTTTVYYSTTGDYWAYCSLYGAAPSGYLGSTRINQANIAKLAMLQAYNPLVLPRTGAALTGGNYIRLLNNKTGWYARGQINSSGVGVTSYQLFDDEGTNVAPGFTLASTSGGLPWPSNADQVFIPLFDLTADESAVAGGSGVVGHGQCIMCMYDNTTRVRCYGTTTVNHAAVVIDWINHLEGGLDPYETGNPAGPGGGDGDGGDTPTDVPFPSVPGIGALDTGFVKLYAPSLSELQALASYLWSGAFDINSFRRIFSDPMDAIMGLSILPFAVSAGTSGPVTIGNQVTTVSMPPVTSQYKEIDCGSLTIHKDVGSYLDYDPYTKFEIYLPYIGLHRISADDVMGKTITLKYVIDVLTGSCIAMLRVDGTVLYSWSGSCSQQIPITSASWSNVFSGAISVAATGAAMLAGGGSFAPLVVANMASTAINSQKPEIRKSGTLSAMSGMMGVQVPYMIETRPRRAIPAGQNDIIGYPSYITSKLGDLTGYTSVDEIHLEGIPATSDELAEIEQMLKEGVIL